MVVCLSSFMARRDAILKEGGFDTRLLYSQDSEFMFRLATTIGFCYVNRPLVLFDRSPVEDRHVGVSSAWNKMEFFLEDSQTRLEGLLRLTKDQPAAIRNLVRQQLGSVHSGWVNCHLEAGEYGKARTSALKAVHMNPTFNVAAKWLLTWVSPRLALRTVQRRKERENSVA